MPKFFINEIPEESVVIAGGDGRHIARVLRAKGGDPITLCDCVGNDYNAEIVSINSRDEVTARILSFCRCTAEPSLSVALYQSLPKADKMDAVVQKAVELGVSAVCPVLSSRCVSRPDAKAAAKKTERWQKISESAAKQSGRGVIPSVRPVTEFSKALEQAAQAGPVLFFSEGGGESLLALAPALSRSVSLFIGPEGGFSSEEVQQAKEKRARLATLGPRILRTETAPIAALAALMLATGNLQ